MAEYGIIQTALDGRVCRFLRHEGPGAAARLEPFMYTGVQVLEPAVFAYMPGAGAFSITEVTYPQMLRAGEALFGYPFEGMWVTVGTPQELESARRVLGELLDSRKGSGVS
jgi:NDP-sugar pyrophosphorylase family protein